MMHSKRHHQQVLNNLKAHIKKQLPESKAKLLSALADQYYSMVSYDDLAERSTEDLYGALKSHWDFMQKREPGECKVNIFNPDYKRDGWKSTHTVIQIIHDDMPFLVDSIRMEINRHGFLVHHIVHMGGLRVKRDKNNRITTIYPRDKKVADSIMEAPIYLEIDRQVDEKVLKSLKESLERVLHDVNSAVDDWHEMLDRMDHALMELEQNPPPLDPAEITESKAFLRWLKDNFILFGCRDYEWKKEKGEKVLKVVPGSGLGVLRETSSKHTRHLSDLPPEAQKLELSSHILIIAKTSTRSTIHRSGYSDCISVKAFDEKGNLKGERRFVGLYTSSAYNSNPKHIPFLRLKVAKVLQVSNLSPSSHAGKNLLNILETLPRDDLFQSTSDELLELSMGIFHLQERQRVRLFIRKDSYGRYYSCLVYVPRESFNTDLTRQMKAILKDALNSDEVTFSTYFSESILARIHFMVRVKPGEDVEFDAKAIERKLVEIGTSWRQELHESLVDYFGEAKGVEFFNKYQHAFLASYKESFTPRTAVYDIEDLESLSDKNLLSMNFYKPVDREDDVVRFKVYQRNHTIPLSDALPILENMGFRVIGERPHKIMFKDGSSAWINDFDLLFTRDISFDIKKVKENFQKTFAAVWLNNAENDGFNYLVLAAQLTWREVLMLRAYARYFQQAGFAFSQAYIAETLSSNYNIAKLLVSYFNGKFEPKEQLSEASLQKIEEQIIAALDDVSNLDEDRILRHYLDVMKATLRTNFFQLGKNKQPKNYVSFKFSPAEIPGLPKPLPMFEIFVYSPRFEGVHLRGAKVARGGLRWSDRREDFRTEVLGLMKAQQVKNAVIVPLGAKGGFVAKQLPVDGTRDEIMAEGVACYQDFIRGLLDITDNIVNQKVAPPKQVVRYDEDDTYLVVAADKGTATFSDIANQISEEYNFWMADAFASGGSTGYDHKKMGITAKGAWESVKRHFREMDFNTQKTDFTVVGIGDMSGDVFGNGMLLSKHIRLLAAFNHIHIFIDPNPDSAVSFKERQRLFKMPRSTWADYNAELISNGGGVFRRSAKSVRLTPEIRQMLNTKRDYMTPNELISALLKSEVDLVWNGGIGTYVKSSSETDADVGDRTNDAVRVNADELQCKVIGEGGNLGFTQLARVEYELNGGRIYTDFIDNSAGVDCSDHEVNIKILLNEIVKNGDMTEKQRNKLLAQMTNEVSDLVLYDNYKQTQAIGLTHIRAKEGVEMYERFIDQLEEKGRLDRELEFLPDEKTLTERKAAGLGFTRPEIAVLLAYSKIWLKEKILESDLPEDPYFKQILAKEFPTPLQEKYLEAMESHPLRREIIATQISNALTNEIGITFIIRMQEETGESVENIVRAFSIVRLIFDTPEIWTAVDALDLKVTADTQFVMLRRLNRLVRRATRWLLRHRKENTDLEAVVAKFQEPVKFLSEKLTKLLPETEAERLQSTIDGFVENGVPKDLAERVAMSTFLFAALDIVEGASTGRYSIEDVAKAYFAVGDQMELSWLREQLLGYKPENHWDALARTFYRGDLDFLQRMLALTVLRQHSKQKSIDARIATWLEENEQQVKRWTDRIANMRASSFIDPVMFTVVLRDLLDLTRANKRMIIFQ